MKADLIRDTEAMGKMDPFILVTCQDSMYRTKVLIDIGKHPEWNETFEIFLLPSNSDVTINFTCYDEDVVMDDLVGEARSVRVSDLIEKVNSELTLEFQGSKAGTLYVTTKLKERGTSDTNTPQINNPHV